MERLEATALELQSRLCIGLDPVVDQLETAKLIVRSTTGLVCAYKVNLAFWEDTRELVQLLDYIRSTTDALIIADAKQTDIGPSGEAYASRFWDRYNFDAVTMSPYMGYDSILPFIHPDKLVLLLCKTSNPSSGALQDLWIEHPEHGNLVSMYMYVAQLANLWGTGVVVGATYPHIVKEIRDAYPDLFMLIPGVGAQGGGVNLDIDDNYIISVSRSIMNSDNIRLAAERYMNEANSNNTSSNLSLCSHPDLRSS